MSVINFFLKQDNRGARKPTTLTWILLCVFVFSSYYLSQNTKTVKKRTKKEISKQKQTIETTSNHLKRDDSTLALNDSDSSSENKNDLKEIPRNPRRLMTSANSKMIVFDDTKDYQSDQLIPLGSMVRCLLIHNIVTNNFNAPVIVQVWEDFYFDGKLLLPFGSRIYGTAFAGRQRDRIMVQFHTIVFQDGKTIKINAIGLSKDGSGGLTGTIIDDHNRKIFIEMAMNFLSGLAAGLQQTATNTVTGLTEVASTSRNAILNGVANTFQKEAQRIQKETEDAKGYAIVLAGNELVVYFEKEADVHPF